jgi:hypothetical protein
VGKQAFQLMAWWRTNRGTAAWLALFALACQLVFSFGHVHIGKASVSFGVPAAAASSDAAADGPSPAKDPAGKGPASPAGDFCAVCANISLAGALILPILAALLLPPVTGVFRHLVSPHAPASFPHRPFGARGPPLA